jgi:hypothetical protein
VRGGGRSVRAAGAPSTVPGGTGIRRTAGTRSTDARGKGGSRMAKKAAKKKATKKTAKKR